MIRGLRADADRAAAGPRRGGGRHAGRTGLLRQVAKTLELLAANPRHPGLRTHVYRSLENPVEPGAKVFTAYVQNRTPGAYRVFWCYGPGPEVITIIAITPHP